MGAELGLFLKVIFISVIVFSLVVFVAAGISISRSRLKELAICSFSVTGVLSSFMMILFVLFPTMSDVFAKIASFESVSFVRSVMKAACDAESFFTFLQMTGVFSVLLFSLCSCSFALFVIFCAFVCVPCTDLPVFAEKNEHDYSQAAGIAERKLFYKFSRILN